MQTLTLTYRATLRPTLDGDICTGELVPVPAGTPVEILRRSSGRLLVKRDDTVPLYGWIYADEVEEVETPPTAKHPPQEYLDAEDNAAKARVRLRDLLQWAAEEPTVDYRADIRAALDAERKARFVLYALTPEHVRKSRGTTPPHLNTDLEAAAEIELAKGQGGPYLIWAVPGESLYLGGSVGKRPDMPKGAVVVENGFGSVFEAGRRFDELACLEMEAAGYRLTDDGTEYEFAPVCELWAGRNVSVSFEVVGRRKAQPEPVGTLFDLGKTPKAEKSAPAPSLFGEAQCETFEAPLPTMRKGMTVNQMAAWKPRTTGKPATRQELFAPTL